MALTKVVRTCELAYKKNRGGDSDRKFLNPHQIKTNLQPNNIKGRKTMNEEQEKIKRNTILVSITLGAMFGASVLLTGCPQPNNGVEPTPTPTPGVELDERANTTIGNGNYVMHNYMSHTYGAPVDAENNVDLVDIYLQRAEAYNKGLLDDFANSLKGRPDAQAYFNGFINEQKRIDYEQGVNIGFDGVINRINRFCKPIFEDMTRSLTETVDQFHLFCYYEALSNEVYKNGLGSDFGARSTNYNPQEDYEFNKSYLMSTWENVHSGMQFDRPFDFQDDYENNNCRQITNGLDQLLNKAAANMGNGITGADLRKVVKYSLNGIDGLDAMHDYYGDTVKTHDPKVCSPVEQEKTVSEVIYNICLESVRAQQQNSMSR